MEHVGGGQRPAPYEGSPRGGLEAVCESFTFLLID